MMLFKKETKLYPILVLHKRRLYRKFTVDQGKSNKKLKK